MSPPINQCLDVWQFAALHHRPHDVPGGTVYAYQDDAGAQPGRVGSPPAARGQNSKDKDEDEDATAATHRVPFIAAYHRPKEEAIRSSCPTRQISYKKSLVPESAKF